MKTANEVSHCNLQDKLRCRTGWWFMQASEASPRNSRSELLCELLKSI